MRRATLGDYTARILRVLVTIQERLDGELPTDIYARLENSPEA